MAQIWIYTHDRWGHTQADNYTDKLRAVAHTLLSDPRAGRAAAFGGGIRRVRAEQHFIFFRDAGEDVIVVRILHERMDARRHFP